MSKLTAIWVIAISLLVIACYSVASYQLEKEYLFGPECGIVEDDVVYLEA